MRSRKTTLRAWVTATHHGNGSGTIDLRFSTSPTGTGVPGHLAAVTTCCLFGHRYRFGAEGPVLVWSRPGAPKEGSPR